MKKTENVVSGTTDTQVTQTTEPCCPEPRHMGLIETIWEEDYDAEMDILTFEVGFHNGELLAFSIKPHQLKHMQLFLSKEEANNRFMQHILKNG